MKNANEVKNRINETAAAGKPFLFGLDFELEHGFFIDNPLQQTEMLWRVGNVSNFTPQPIEVKKHFTPHYINRVIYGAKYKLVYDGLYHGDTFLINLTVKTPIDTHYSLEEILKASTSTYAILLPERFVCFSPETFVKIDAQGSISSYPMKGTIDASLPHAEETMLDDYKETADHHTLVDLIRSDLSRVATQVYRKSTLLNSSHIQKARMPSSA